MTFNLKRLGALAIAQCGAFVVVLIIGVFGGPGHNGPAGPTHSPTPTHSSSSPTAKPTGKKTTHGGGQGTHTSPPASHTPTATPQVTATPKTSVTPK